MIIEPICSNCYFESVRNYKGIDVCRLVQLCAKLPEQCTTFEPTKYLKLKRFLTQNRTVILVIILGLVTGFILSIL